MMSKGADVWAKLELMSSALHLRDVIVADKSCLVPKTDHESASDEHV